MLRWCQNVNVYNIENHYHFYAEQEPKSRALSNIPSGKLKAGAISVSSTLNSKRNSKSCLKKGLKLSKMLRNPEERKYKQELMNEFRKQYSSMALNQHVRSVTDSFKDIAQTRSMQSQRNRNHQRKKYEKMEDVVIQQEVQSRYKMSAPTIDFKQQNQLLLTNLYSTQSGRKKRYIEIKNNNLNLLEIIPAKSLHEVQQISTSRNIKPNEQTKSQFQLSESFNGYQNSRYNMSRSVSVFNAAQQQSNNDRVYFKILQMSRGEAREASIILSNILSRSAHHSFCETRKCNQKSNERRLNFEDKLTILSHNDAQSQASLKIQQSELYDSDPKNNFTLLNKQLKTSTYTVNLAIQNYLKCVVSLKQICFRQMSTISQELQMYQFLEQNISKSDTYRNILELYQVQMTNGSYLLIKQPFTHCTAQYAKSLSDQQFKNFMKNLQETISILLTELGQHLIFPTRLFSFNDFVLCQSVIKFHDMSIFKQMKDPLIDIETLVREIMDVPSRETSKECHN